MQSSSRRVELKRFDPTKMKNDRLCLFLGRRGTGKSMAMEDIMYNMRSEFDSGVVMSGTETANQTWGVHVPPSFIYDKYENGVVRDICRNQMKLRKEKGGSIKPVFLVLEDVLYDKTLNSDEALRWLFFNGRHAKVFTLISMQYYASMKPELRTQIDYVFLTRQTSVVVKEAIWKHFAGVVPDFESFNRILERVTQDYTILVLDQTAISNRIEDCMFWYKAKPRPQFKLGNRLFWEFHFANSATEGELAATTSLDLSVPNKQKVEHVSLLPAYASKISTKETAQRLLTSGEEEGEDDYSVGDAEGDAASVVDDEDGASSSR